MDIFVFVATSNLATAYGVWRYMRSRPDAERAAAYAALVRSLTPADQHWLRKNNGKLEVIVEDKPLRQPAPPKGGFNVPPVTKTYRIGGYVEGTVTST